MISAVRTRGYSPWSWILQAASGVLLVVLVVLHMVAQHFAADGLLDYQGVINHLRNPLVFGLETVFSATVLFHAFAGARAILFDLNLGEEGEHRVTTILTIVGVAMFLYGLVLTWWIVR